MTQRLEPSFEYDSKKWAFFFEHYSKNRTLFLRRRKELNLFLILTQRIDLFSQFDSKNWTFFLNLTQRIFFFQMWLKELNLFLNMIQRIEFLSDMYDSKSKNRTFFFSIRLNESNIFFCMWFMFSRFFWVKNFSKNWIFIWLKEWYLTQRLEIYVFEIWFKELDLFFLWLADFFFSKIMTQKIFEKYDSKNWTLFVWLKELNPFCMTQRIEPFFCMTQRIEPFFSYLPQRIELFFFLKFWLGLSPFFVNRTQKIELFLYDLQNWTSSFFTNYDSKNWTLCKKETQKIEIFFLDKWLTELNTL